MTELITAGVSLLGSLGPLLLKAITAKDEEHAAILAEAQSAAAAFLNAVDNLSYTLMTQDKAADEALLAKFDHSDAKP